MVKIGEIKYMIIEKETEWLKEVHGDDEAQMYINGMKDEIKACIDINDIVDFYIGHGFKINEAYENIIDVLRENTQIKE